MKYDYSFKESLLSLAPLVEKTYLALDSGNDTTEEEIKKLPSIKIVPSRWDMGLKKGLVLSVETNKALEALRADHGSDDHAWGIYLQADEVLHEEDHEILKRDIEEAARTGCDAISFRYLHFWQTHHHVAISRKWYPHEVRAIKLKTPIESWGDAQGFRNYKKIFYTEARIFHYGHVREQSSYKEKMRDMGSLYHEASDLEERLEKGLKDARKNKCVLYFGTHPKVMKERILRMNDIWELESVDHVYIVGNPEKYSKDLISKLAAKKVTWCKSRSVLPAVGKSNIIITEPTWIDHLLKRSTVPLKMKSKLARPWSDDFRFVLLASEKRVGFKS
ncbi:MAG: hypothetical protein ACXVLQ_04070 [Bacteriovorax sp.]